MRTDNIKMLATALTASFALALASCENELPVYSFPDDSLNFQVKLDETSGEVMEKNYSFIYSGDDVMVDTLWFKVDTQGFLSDTDRPFQLQQIPSGEDFVDAQADVHYLGFDSEEMRSRLVIPAGANTARFPIVVYRHASLSEGDVRLYFQVKPNGIFSQGMLPYRTVKVVISNTLSKPDGWENYYFGTYGPVKHKFMIDETGLRWDDDFCTSLDDFGYIQYLTMMLHQRLQEVNAERKKQGLDILKEATGKAVKFDFGASY